MKAEVHLKSAKKKSLFFKQWQMWVMVAIPMFFVILFQYVPMVGIIVAFKEYKYNTGIWFSEWCGFDNFKFLFASGDLTHLIANTVGFNAISIALGLFIPLVFAVLMYGFTSKGSVRVYQTISILPSYLSYVIISFLVYAFLSPTGGTVNSLLNSFGMEGHDWYQDPRPWWLILLITKTWQGTGMGSILYYTTLINIDESLFEAAKLDGANKLKIFRYIVIPCLTSVIIFSLTLSVGGIFNGDFGLFYNVTKNSTALYPTTDIIATYIYRLLRQNNEIGMSSAAGLMQSVIGCFMVVVTNLIIRRIEPEKSLF